MSHSFFFLHNKNQKQFEIQKEELRNRTIRESSKNARELIAKKQEEALDRENRLKNDILKANQRFDRLAEETEKRMANLDKFLEHEISSSEVIYDVFF
jgi:protease II